MRKTGKVTKVVGFVKCEFCGKDMPDDEYIRCYFCGKRVCSDDAHYMAVYVEDYPHRRLRSMRVCPNCKIKPKYRLFTEKTD